MKCQQMFVSIESYRKCGVKSTVLSIKLEYFSGSLVLIVSCCDEVLHYGLNSDTIFLTEHFVTSQIILLKQPYTKTYDLIFYDVYSVMYSYRDNIFCTLMFFFLWSVKMLYLHNPCENLSSDVPDDMFYLVPIKLATTLRILVDSCLNSPF